MVHPFPIMRAAVFGAGVALLVLAPGMFSGRAGAQEVFTVTDVRVDATAKTAAAARETARAEGERRALGRLLARLTLRADQARLPVLERSQIAALVRNFEVEEEKTSSVRYLAKLTIRFKRKALRRLLRAHDIPFAETLSEPVLVLPVYEVADALALWDDPNPWREAWARQPKRDGLVPLVVPLGDLSDIADIGAEQALRGDDARISAIAWRYGAADALIALARLRAVPLENLPQVEVSVGRFGASAREWAIVETFTAASPDGLEELLARAAEVVAVAVEENWKRDNILRFDRQGDITVAVPIERLEDWLEVRKRLQRVAFIRRSDLVYLSRGEARARLRFIGEVEQLALALAQSDLILSREASSWILRLGSFERQGVAQPSVVNR